MNRATMILKWLILVQLAVLTGCASTTTNETIEAKPAIVESLRRYAKEFVLTAGDQIEVAVYRFPELSRITMVRRDGYISIPVLDEIKAAGLTIKELDDKVTALLRERLVDPDVTIIIMNPLEPMVYVVGDVGQVTAIPLREARTAAQAIAKTSGTLRSSATRDVSIIRLEENGHLKAYTVSRKMKGQPALYMALQNTALQADDLIVVPESIRAQIIRGLQDYVTTPLTALNNAINPYFQFKLIDAIDFQ
jgi:polysaccharide biosynthesis/export protein